MVSHQLVNWIFIASESLILSEYNQVFFPENHYYNSDALPIEWMEIFESKETLREIEQLSEFSDVYE